MKIIEIKKKYIKKHNKLENNVKCTERTSEHSTVSTLFLFSLSISLLLNMAYGFRAL